MPCFDENLQEIPCDSTYAPTGPTINGTDSSSFSLSGLGSFFSGIGTAIGSVFKAVNQPQIGIQAVPGGYVTSGGAFVATNPITSLTSGSGGLLIIGAIVIVAVLLLRK